MRRQKSAPCIYSTAKSDRNRRPGARLLAANWIAQGAACTARAALRQRRSGQQRSANWFKRPRPGATKDRDPPSQTVCSNSLHALWPALARAHAPYMKAIAVGAVIPERRSADRPPSEPTLRRAPSFYKHHSDATRACNASPKKLPPGIPAPDHREPILACTATSAPCKRNRRPGKRHHAEISKSPPWKIVTRRWSMVPSPQTLQSLPCTSPRTDAPKTSRETNSAPPSVHTPSAARAETA